VTHGVTRRGFVAVAHSAGFACGQGASFLFAEPNPGVIPANAGLSTAELVIHFFFPRNKQDQNGFPLSRE
jgi:hypothetical protein